MVCVTFNRGPLRYEWYGEVKQNTFTININRPTQKHQTTLILHRSKRNYRIYVLIRRGSRATYCIPMLYAMQIRLRWSRGSVPAFGIQVRGFAPGQKRRIFRAKNIPSTPSFGGEVKPTVPCRGFTACRRSLNVTWKSAFRQNSRTFLAQSSTLRRWVLLRGDTRGDAWWRKLELLTQTAQ
jgi:hypothetical protein